MTAFSPFSPVDIRVLNKTAGLDAVQTLLEGADGFAVLADASVLEKLRLAPFVEKLLASKKGVLLQEIPANPTAADVCRALHALAGRQVHALVAIGGGSCMDLAKAISALYHLLPGDRLSEESVLEAILQQDYKRPHPFVDILALPTTAGTGSEVTKWATIWDPEHGRKLSIDCVENFPKAAILIPELTASMSPGLTLSTGLDALSHAMEAFWAKSRTPLSKALAIAAIGKILTFLPAAVRPETAGDLDVRREMCLGSLLAGLAFSITRTTACHSISYPLTMLFGLPHGFAAAMTLSGVMKRNEEAVPEIQDLHAIFCADGGFSAWLEQLTAPVRPLRLGAFGIREQDLEKIAELTFTAGRMDNNPVLFSRQEVLEILRECL